MKTFGQIIKEARKSKDLTLEQVAKTCRTHKGYISGIENGVVRAPSPKIVPLLCKKLELDLERMAALAWWEKRPKSVTASAVLGLLEDVIVEQQQAEPKTPQDPPAAAPQLPAADGN
jgi:transcriptional regulator with XRE-family HTH domain